MMQRFLIALALGVLFSSAAAADDAFVPGRPGKNESPIVTPAHRLQIETELFNAGRDREDGVKTDSLSLAATSFRYGLGGGYEAEAIVTPYLRQHVREGGESDTASGAGDLALRLRKNLTGQDGADFAAALIGYVTLPTSQEHLGDSTIGGGVLLPLQWSLTDRLSFATTLGAAAVDADKPHVKTLDASFVAGLGYTFTDKWGGFAEAAFERTFSGGAQTESTMDFGVTYLAAQTVQLDLGANVGVSGAADDLEIYAGVAKRF